MKQTQETGSHSLAIQANTVNLGVTPDEVRQIALDIFRANFYRLSEEAQRLAEARAAELTERLLKRLAEEAPSMLFRAKDPDMQYALFTAQREYARSGDGNLGDILLNLLVERVRAEDSQLPRIIVNEALEVVPKLTRQQMDLLTLVFLIRHVSDASEDDQINMIDQLRNYARPFLPSLTLSSVAYQHIHYTGCAVLENIIHLERFLAARSPGSFMKPIPMTRWNLLFPRGQFKALLEQISGKNAYRLKARTYSELVEQAEPMGASYSDVERIWSFVRENQVQGETFRARMAIEFPEFQGLSEVWNETALGRLELTSVGTMIAATNFERTMKKRIDLSQWIAVRPLPSIR